jgi:hypothetical protein
MTDQKATWPRAARTPEVIGRALASSRVSAAHIERVAAWAMEFNRDAADAGTTIRAYFGNPGRLATHVHCLLLPALAATDALPKKDAGEDAMEAVVTRTYDAWATAAAPQLAQKFSEMKNRTSP